MMQMTNVTTTPYLPVLRRICNFFLALKWRNNIARKHLKFVQCCWISAGTKIYFGTKLDKAIVHNLQRDPQKHSAMQWFPTNPSSPYSFFLFIGTGLTTAGCKEQFAARTWNEWVRLVNKAARSRDSLWGAHPPNTDGHTSCGVVFSGVSRLWEGGEGGGTRQGHHSCGLKTTPHKRTCSKSVMSWKVQKCTLCEDPVCFKARIGFPFGRNVWIQHS